jgi:hypothetical protein
MKTWTTLVLGYTLAVGVLAQQTERPQLKVRLLTEKDVYTLNERVVVKSELTNLTSRTLCFPVPDQECETTSTGWVIATLEPSNSDERDSFICHTDGRGAERAKLESDIKNHWVMLAPNAVYTTKAAEVNARLNVVGDWKLKASYHPPVGAFSANYEKDLQSAADGFGCRLPDSTAVAEPKVVTVLSKNSKER